MADIEQDRADLNALVREAHECIKDLNRAIREGDTMGKAATVVLGQLDDAIEQLHDRIKELMELQVQEFIELSVKQHMDALYVAMREHTDKAVTNIYARFDELYADIVNEDDVSKIKALLMRKGYGT